MDDLQVVFVPTPDVAYRTIAGSVAIVHTTANRIVRLNETGSAIWGMLDGRCVREIAQRVAEEFEVDPIQAERDTIRFLEYLQERGFVTKK